MKPFHSHLGASGFVERNATGPTSCLVVQPTGKTSLKLGLIGATFNTPGKPATNAVNLGPWPASNYQYFARLAAGGFE